MQVTSAQVAQVKERVAHFFKLGNELFGLELPVAEVRFTLKGTTGGRACTSGNWVDFNPVLMADNWDHYWNDVIPHEVAHIVADHRFGPEVRAVRKNGRRVYASHGRHWKRVMAAFGVEAKRCHSMDVSKVRKTQTKYQYRCTGCGKMIPVGPKHHKSLQRGVKLTHTGCANSRLEFIKELGRLTWAEAIEGRQEAPKKAPKKARAGSQIARAVDIYGQCQQQGIHARQAIMQQMMALMGVDKAKAARLHDQAKKKVA